MLPEAFLACPPFLLWNLPSLTVESTLSTPCSRSDPLSLAKVQLSPTLTLSPLTIWCFGKTALFFFFGKSSSGVLANCSLCGTEATLSFSADPVCSSCSAEAILHTLCWSRQHQQACPLFFYYLTLALSSPPSFLIPQTLWQELGSLLLFYQATMDPRTLVSPGGRRS